MSEAQSIRHSVFCAVLSNIQQTVKKLVRVTFFSEKPSTGCIHACTKLDKHKHYKAYDTTCRKSLGYHLKSHKISF